MEQATGLDDGLGAPTAIDRNLWCTPRKHGSEIGVHACKSDPDRSGRVRDAETVSASLNGTPAHNLTTPHNTAPPELS